MTRRPRPSPRSRIARSRRIARPFLRRVQPRAPSPSIRRSDSVAGIVWSVNRTRVAPAAARRELVDAERANAVVLAGATHLDDPVRAIDLGERHVAPAEAVARRLDAKAGARAASDRVDPRQMPVDQVVVGELGVVGDVLQVVEHPLARSGR